MLAQRNRGTDPNKELGAKSRFAHGPCANATAHRMSDEDVYRSKCALTLLEVEQDICEGPRSRRFSISRLIHGKAMKASSGECFAETKQHLFRAAVSVSEKRNGMRTRRCGEKSKRGGVCSQHYFFDANACLDDAGEYGPKNQGGDGCCNEATVSANTHGFILALLEIPNRRMQSSRIMPGCKDEKEAIPSVFEGIASTTRHYQLHGTIALMPSSA